PRRRPRPAAARARDRPRHGLRLRPRADRPAAAGAQAHLRRRPSRLRTDEVRLPKNRNGRPAFADRPSGYYVMLRLVARAHLELLGSAAPAVPDLEGLAGRRRAGRLVHAATGVLVGERERPVVRKGRDAVRLARVT